MLKFMETWRHKFIIKRTNFITNPEGVRIIYVISECSKISKNTRYTEQYLECKMIFIKYQSRALEVA